MTTLYVEYCTRTKLSCTNAANQDVILCLEDAALVAPADCPAPSNGTYDGAFMPATICQWYSTGDCGTGWYVYTFSYDDALLADGSVPLQKADITGVFCKDCLVSYLEYKAGSEAYIRTEEDETQTFVSQHGCEYPIVAGGGDCVTEVTTAELNAAISGSTLVPGCTYIITDHVQGRLVAGTQVVVTALSVNQVSSACSVLSTYDPVPWRGSYDSSSNTITELADNLGNVCRQYAPYDGFGPARSPVNEFDWGNPYITNCLVDDSKWYIDYGVAPLYGIDGVKMTNGARLDLRGWVGEWLAHLIITNYGEVDFSNGNMSAEEVTVDSGYVIITSNSPYNFLFVTTIADSAFVVVDQEIDSEIYLEGVFAQGYSGIYHRIPGVLTVFGTTVTGFGEIRTGVYGVPVSESVTEVWVENCTISGARNGAPIGGRVSNIYVHGTNTQQISITETHVSSSATIEVFDVTATTLVQRCSADTYGLLSITGGGTINNTKVSQGILNTAGYNLTSVYLMGESTKTCTANNTNKGKDYFNDNIV